MSVHVLRPRDDGKSRWLSVPMTWREISLAAQHGLQRSLYHAAQKTPGGVNQLFGFYDGIGKDIGAVLSGMAVAKEFNLYHTGLTPKSPDVGGFIEVRAIRNMNHGLLLHDSDPDLFIAVCALVDDPSLIRLVGWIDVAEGKSERFRAEPQPGRHCYLVPQSSLNPMNTLRETISSKCAWNETAFKNGGA